MFLFLDNPPRGTPEKSGEGESGQTPTGASVSDGEEDDGVDWKEKFRQQQEELKAMREQMRKERAEKEQARESGSLN